MDTFIAIFSQLGVDSSLVYQFCIVAVVFTLAHFLFLKELQYVLEQREEKTSKAESQADEAMDKVNQLMADYKAKIDQAHKKSMESLALAKNEVVQKLTNEYKASEKEVQSHIDESRVKLQAELETSKKKMESEVDNLTQVLIKKVTG